MEDSEHGDEAALREQEPQVLLILTPEEGGIVSFSVKIFSLVMKIPQDTTATAPSQPSPPTPTTYLA